MNSANQARLRAVASLDSRAAATVATGPCVLEMRLLGQVDFPDGRIFACDPLVPMDQDPFFRKVAVGSYDVSLIVAVPTDPTYRGRPTVPAYPVAGVLDLEGAPPVNWAPALRGPDHNSGAYGVDAGTGCFMGSTAAANIFEDNDVTGQMIAERLRASLGGTVDVARGGNLAFFSTNGDGVFETWWGEDAAGNPSMLLTELDEVQSPDELAELLETARRPWWRFWA